MNTLDYVYAAVDEIKSSKDYIDFVLKRNELFSSLKTEIDSFNKAKSAFFEAKEYGDYYPGMKEIKNRLVEAKTKLYENPLFKEYQGLEKVIQKKLDYISLELSKILDISFQNIAIESDEND